MNSLTPYIIKKTAYIRILPYKDNIRRSNLHYYFTAAAQFSKQTAHNLSSRLRSRLSIHTAYKSDILRAILRLRKISELQLSTFVLETGISSPPTGLQRPSDTPSAYIITNRTFLDVHNIILSVGSYTQQVLVQGRTDHLLHNK